jgi:hypothetical protein
VRPESQPYAARWPGRAIASLGLANTTDDVPASVRTSAHTGEGGGVAPWAERVSRRQTIEKAVDFMTGECSSRVPGRRTVVVLAP